MSLSSRPLSKNIEISQWVKWPMGVYSTGIYKIIQNIYISLIKLIKYTIQQLHNALVDKLWPAHYTTSSSDQAIWLVNKTFRTCSNQHYSTADSSLKILLRHVMLFTHLHGNMDFSPFYFEKRHLLLVKINHKLQHWPPVGCSWQLPKSHL